MDPSDGSALPDVPSLPPELLERVARFLESHADALAFALSSKSALHIVETVTEMLGKFSLDAGSKSGAATFEAMDRSRIRDLAIRPSMYDGCWTDRTISACRNLDTLTLHACEPQGCGSLSWTRAVRHLRRLHVSRSCRWSLGGLTRAVEALPLVALLVEGEIKERHAGHDGASFGPRAHPTMRTIVLARESLTQIVVLGVMRAALGPRTQTIVVASPITGFILGKMTRGALSVRTIVVRCSDDKHAARPLLAGLADLLKGQPISTVGVMVRHARAHEVVEALAPLLPPRGRIAVWVPATSPQHAQGRRAPRPLSASESVDRAVSRLGTAQRMFFVVDVGASDAAGVVAARAAVSGESTGHIELVTDLATLVRSIAAEDSGGPRPRAIAAATADVGSSSAPED